MRSAAVATVALLPLRVLAATPSSQITDGGFEQPVAPAAGFALFATGQSFGGWRVVGAQGSVGLVQTDFSQAGFTFHAFAGRQYLDLTGGSNTATGVAQTVTTQPGTTYTLSFALGNTYDPGGIFGTTTTVAILVDGSLLKSVTNDHGKGTTAIGWQRYSVPFVAAQTTTTIEFLNGDPPTDTASALDDVSLVAFEDGRSSVASSLPGIGDALGSVAHDAAALGIAAGVTLFIAFPAQLFNHTFQENYDEIVGFIERRLTRLRRLRASVYSHLGPRLSALRVALVVAIGAVLGGLLDPTFGLTTKSLYTYIGMVVTAVILIAVAATVAFSFRSARRRGREFAPAAYPAGLVVAALCVLISRLSHFQPGYLYGVIAGVAFSKRLSDREEGQLASLSALATLTVAVLAWGLWTAIKGGAAGGATPPIVIADDVLAAIFVAGLTGTVITLLPMSFLPGGHITAWSRVVWAATFLLAVFGLVGVLLWPNRNGHAGTAPIVTVVALLVLFGGSSVSLWWLFEKRKRRSHDV